MTTPDSATRFTRDALGRVTGTTLEAWGSSWRSTFRYHGDSGDLLSVTYPTGARIEYGRDTAGRISSITIDGVTLFDSITYAPLGPWSEARLGSSFSIRRTLDSRYHITRIQAGPVDLLYSRDPMGRVSSLTGKGTPVLDQGVTRYETVIGTNRLESVSGMEARLYGYKASVNGKTKVYHL